MNQEPKFTITSPLKPLEKQILSLPKISVEKSSIPGLLIKYKLFLNDLELMYVTNINKSYVDFSRIYNFINQLPDLSIDVMTNDIDLPFSYSKGAFQWRENLLTGL